MTSKYRIENIEAESQKLTDAIIKHFTDKAKGQGYFYKDQDWDINRIVKKHLENVKLTNKVEPTYLLLTSTHLAAQPGATAIMQRTTTDEYYILNWDRDNPLVGSQMDGSYYPSYFKIIDRSTYDRVRADIIKAYSNITEIVKNVT